MVDCDYESYRENSSLIWEKTNTFYERARVLNRLLDENTAPKPAMRRDSGGEASGSGTEEVEDPFLAEIPNIMTDVEDSVTKYADEMAKKVLKHTGGADISSYLGHIFSTGLNFQTSMWQLITLEAVYLPTIMREHLRPEASTLRLFVECLPTLAPCAVPPPLLPVSTAASLMRLLSASSTKIVRSSPLDATGGAKATTKMVQAVPACQTPQGPSTSSEGPGTTPKGPATTPKVKPKLSPAATNTVLDKAIIGRVVPVRDTLSVPNQSSASAGRLASLAQATSSVRSRPRENTNSNSQLSIKRPRLDENTESATTSSTVPGSSSSVAIPVDDEEDEIQFIDAYEDDGISVCMDAQGGQTTTSNRFTLQSLDAELLAEYPEGVRGLINKLRNNHYTADLQWMQDLCRHLPQDTRNDRNVDSMVAHVLAAQQNDTYMRKSFKSVQRILDGDEDPEFFDESFKKVLMNVCRNQLFKSPQYCNMKNFQFDYLVACFLDEDDKPFPANDKRFRMQMTGLTSLHSVGALSRPKIHSGGVSIEKIFCPHCGYHVNNPGTLNTHIRMHYRASMFCAHKGCNMITNNPQAMAEHGESKHLYGTRNRTPSKSKK